jgi:hypothetical protein
MGRRSHCGADDGPCEAVVLAQVMLNGPQYVRVVVYSPNYWFRHGAYRVFKVDPAPGRLVTLTTRGSVG